MDEVTYRIAKLSSSSVSLYRFSDSKVMQGSASHGDGGRIFDEHGQRRRSAPATDLELRLAEM